MELSSDSILCIISVVALLSPIITTVINNYFQIKRENIQNYEMFKREALNNFIDSWLKCCVSEVAYPYKLNYYKSLNALFIYFKDVPDTASSLFSVKVEHRLEMLNFIVTTLSKQISKK